MNKIKFLYDVAKTMKDKEALSGVVEAEVQKNQVKVFSFQNKFEKNLLTGQTKAKISTELDYEGKTVKHESSTEFSVHGNCEKNHHELVNHLHHHAFKCCGLKRKLAKLTFALGILNSLKIEEQEDKTTVISLNMNEIPEDLKTLIQEKMRHAGACHSHGPHGFMKEFCAMETLDFVLNIFINKNYEVETIVFTIDGTQPDDENKIHMVKAISELSFTW